MLIIMTTLSNLYRDSLDISGWNEYILSRHVPPTNVLKSMFLELVLILVKYVSAYDAGGSYIRKQHTKKLPLSTFVEENRELQLR